MTGRRGGSATGHLLFVVREVWAMYYVLTCEKQNRTSYVNTAQIAVIDPDEIDDKSPVEVKILFTGGVERTFFVPYQEYKHFERTVINGEPDED